MKLAITTSGENLEASLDSRLGRAPRFVIYDLDSDSFTLLDNTQNLNAAQGAGIQSAQHIIASGAQAVITGHCGPKAFRVLSTEGVAVYNCLEGTVQEAIEKFKAGQLQSAQDADVESHWV